MTSKTNDEAHLFHSEWIRYLLKNYYDPMYEYQLNKKLHRVIFRGDKYEFLEWVKQIEKNK